MSIESVMPSSHLILCRPLLLLFQSFPASGSFQMSQLFISGGQSIGVSASTALVRYNYFTFHEVHTLICTSQCFLVYSYSSISITTAKFQDISITSERNPTPTRGHVLPRSPWQPLISFCVCGFPTQVTAYKWSLATEGCCLWSGSLSLLLLWHASGKQYSIVTTHHTCLSACQLVNAGDVQCYWHTVAH